MGCGEVESLEWFTFPIMIRMLCKNVIEWTDDLIHALDVTNATVGLGIEKEQSFNNL